MATVSAVSPVPLYVSLFSPEVVSRFATTFVGLEELEASQQKTVKVSLAVFALYALGTIALGLLRAVLPKKISWALLGIGVIATIASARRASKANQSYNRNIDYIRYWKAGFKHLVSGEVFGAMCTLELMLKSEYLRLPDISYPLNPNDLFHEKAYDNFAILDVRQPSAAINKNSHLLKTVFADAMIWSILFHLKMVPPRADLDDAYFKERIDIAAHCSSARTYGSREPQQALYQLFSDATHTTRISELQNQVKEIPLPKKISIGHGLLAEILGWIDELTPHSFDAEGKVISAPFPPTEGFANLKLNLEKAKSWLIKDQRFTAGSTEEIVINAMLNSSTLYELYQATVVISPEQRQELRNKIADYDRPFPT